MRCRHSVDRARGAADIAVDMMDNASALPTCPQRQQQQKTALRNGPKSPTRLHEEAKHFYFRHLTECFVGAGMASTSLVINIECQEILTDMTNNERLMIIAGKRVTRCAVRLAMLR